MQEGSVLSNPLEAKMQALPPCPRIWPLKMEKHNLCSQPQHTWNKALMMTTTVMILVMENLKLM